MTHWRALIERDFIGAWDLVGNDGKPRAFTMTIAKVESQGIAQPGTSKTRRKLTIRFREAEKALIAGATICSAIEGMYGDQIESWPGKQVTLYPTTTTVKGKAGVPCVRVKPEIPRGAKTEKLESRPVDPEIRAKHDEAFGRKEGEREPGEEG